MTAIIVIVVVVILAAWLVSMYNSLVKMRNNRENAFADIDVQLKQRHDLVPQLVETVKGYAAHEKDTLERVINARNGAIGAKTIDEKIVAENALSSALSGLKITLEAYPDLKANQNFLQLQEEIADLEKTTVATGKVEPRDEVLIKPQISGIISEVYKEAGQSIRQGEVIAKVKVIPELGTLNSAESRVRLADINARQAETDFARIEKLFNDKLISDEEYEKGEVSVKQAREELQTAKDNLEIVKEGITKNSASFSSTLIRSTITGLILDVPIKVGNSVIMSNTFNDGTTIATVANMNDLIFRGNLDETEVGRVHEGMPVKLTIGALQDLSFNATLEYISPKGVEENGANQFEIKAAIQAPDSVQIRSGYSANAEIVLERALKTLALPESTVEFSGDSTFVYVLTDSIPQQKFKRQQIEVGMSDGIKIAVKSGLTAKDKVRGAEKSDK